MERKTEPRFSYPQGTGSERQGRMSAVLGIRMLLLLILLMPLGTEEGKAQRSVPESAWTDPAPLFAGTGPVGGGGIDELLAAKVAVARGTLFVVWAQRADAGAGGTPNAEVFLARSEDSGETFSVLNLSQSPAVDSRFPDLWVDGSNVYVVWEEGTGQEKEIYFTRSRDRGRTFSDPINVSNTPNREDRDARVVADSRLVAIVWEQAGEPTDDSDIFFTFSRDGGETFGSVRNLSSTSGTLSTFPQVALGASGTVYVAWEDEPPTSPGGTARTEIFFVALNLRGRAESVGPRLNVSGSPEVPSLNPRLIASRDRVFLAWEEGGTGAPAGARTDREARLLGEDAAATAQAREIYLAVSKDGGRSFTVTNVSNTPEFDSRRPALALSGMRTLFVAWEEEEGALDDSTVLSTGRTDIWLTRSLDGGETFFPPLNLSHSFGVASRNVSLWATQRKVFVVWEEEVGAAGGGIRGGGTRSREILFARSPDGGETFQVAQAISRSLARPSRLPQVVGENRVVLVLWEESPRTPTGGAQPFQLFATRNENDGVPFRARSRGLARAVRVTRVEIETPPAQTTRTDEGQRRSSIRERETEKRTMAVAVTATAEAEALSGGGVRFLVRARSLPPSVDGTARVELSVYDLAGRRLFRQQAPLSATGELSFRWPLRHSDGRPVAHGVYLYRVRLLDTRGDELGTVVRKLVVLR